MTNKKILNIYVNQENYIELLERIKNNDIGITHVRLINLEAERLSMFLEAMKENHIIVHISIDNFYLMPEDVQRIEAVLVNNYIVTSFNFEENGVLNAIASAGEQVVDLYPLEYEKIEKIILRNNKKLFSSIDSLLQLPTNYDPDYLQAVISNFPFLYEDNIYYIKQLRKIKHYLECLKYYYDLDVSPLETFDTTPRYINYGEQTYEILEVEKDENSFFHAMSRQTSIYYEIIREMAIDHILQNPNMYNWEVTERRDDIERYIDSLSNLGTWEDRFIIQAVANLGYSINIFSRGENIVINPSHSSIAIELSVNIEYVNDSHFRPLTPLTPEELYAVNPAMIINRDSELDQPIAPMKKITIFDMMREAFILIPRQKSRSKVFPDDDSLELNMYNRNDENSIQDSNATSNHVGGEIVENVDCHGCVPKGLFGSLFGLHTI
jgi:hypothetical protein